MANVTKKKIIDAMSKLGIYKEEFNGSIERYVKLSSEYTKIYNRYVKSGFQCTVATASGEKKSPVVVTLESLRRDLLTLESELGLTPKGLQKLNDRAFEKPKKSKAGSLI